jgi:hypothetical protein
MNLCFKYKKTRYSILFVLIFLISSSQILLACSLNINPLLPPFCKYLPFGSKMSDDFARGKINSEKISFIYIYLTSGELDLYADGCKKIPFFPRKKISNSIKIEQLINAIRMPSEYLCEGEKCNNNYNFRIPDSGYSGIVIAHTKDKKVAYFYFKIYPDQSADIKMQPHGLNIITEGRGASTKFITYLLPILRELNVKKISK